MLDLLKPEAHRTFVEAFRERHPSIPIHTNILNTAGVDVASMLTRTEARADVDNVPLSSISSITWQWAVSYPDRTIHRTINLKDINDYSAHWEQTRALYALYSAHRPQNIEMRHTYEN